MDDSELLQEFAKTRSQDAFADLVARYVDMVYSAARRQLHDPGAAEDATQAVFLLLADKASGLQSTQLSAWLFATTRYVCANERRKQARRKLHERKAAEMKAQSDSADQPGGGQGDGPAWKQIAPLLDEAIDSLPAGEKDIVLLRYFEKCSFKEVGQKFSISEEAARKRVDRATDKLREFFARSGVTTSPAWSLEAVLLAHAVTNAPAMLAKLVAAKAGASAVAAGASGLTHGGLTHWGTIMATATGKKVAIVGLTALLLVGGTAAVVVPAINRSTSKSASQGRQVVVPMPAMSATTKNGIILELIGVSNFTTAAPWWEANGSPLPRAPFTKQDWMRSQPEAGYNLEQNFEFAFRARFASADIKPTDIFLQPAFTPDTPRQSWETPRPLDTDDPGLMRVSVTFNRPLPAKVRIAVGVAAGPWTIAAQTDTPMVETTHTLATKPKDTIVFKPLKEVAGETQFVIGYPPNLFIYNVDKPQTRLVATVDGKDIPAEQRSSGGVPGVTFGDLVVFKAPAEKITSIRWETRAYEPVVFDNVSLISGTITEPTVKLLPLGDPLVTPRPVTTKPVRPTPRR